MTDPEVERDQEVAAVLAIIPVPDYEPGFWDRLEERLAQEPRPVRVIGSPERGAPSGGRVEVAPDDDLTVVPRARRSGSGLAGRRRGLAVLAAAAAIVVAVLAVRLATDDGGSVTASDPPGTTPTLAPLSTLAGNRVGGTLHQVGSAESPQDAFVSWVTAARDGDLAGARALLGPNTVAYLGAIGSGLDDVGQAYAPWADPEGRRIEVIDFGEVEGRRVAGVVLSRPAADGVETVHDAVPVVQGPTGWMVEPSAFDPDVDSRIEVVAPEVGEGGLLPLAAGAQVQVQVSGAGVYYLGCDGGRLAGFVPGDATDGTLSWTPEPPLEAGEHLLIAAHLSPKVQTILVAPFTVAGPGS